MKSKMPFKQFLKQFLLLDIIRGFGITLRHLFEPKITQMYPWEKTEYSPRFRGEHALRLDEKGEERCIACKLCEAVCPSQAITIESMMREDGSRRTSRYDIDMVKCIFCGLCEEACPVEAIVEGPNMEYAEYNRQDLVYGKDKLIANGKRWKIEIDDRLDKDRKYR